MIYAINEPAYYERQGSVRNLSRPQVIGEFSINKEKDFFPDARQKRYLSLPKSFNNLGWDFSSEHQKTKEAYGAIQDAPDLWDKRLEPMLKWVSMNPDKIVRTFSGQNFVCHAGLLATLTNCAYSTRDDWLIRASKFKDCIYIATYNTEEYKRYWLSMSDQEKYSTFVGDAFEKVLTTEGRNGSMCTYGKYKQVFRRSLGSHTLFYSAEVDGIDEEGRCVEIKTIYEDAYRKSNFCKFFQTWNQCQWAGIERIFFGLKNWRNIIDTIIEHRTQDLSNKLQAGRQKSKTGLGGYNFCDEFFDCVKQVVVKEHPVVYNFYHEGNAKKYSVTERRDIPGNEILPDEFKKEWERKTSSGAKSSKPPTFSL